jgi:hypothetical protein
MMPYSPCLLSRGNSPSNPGWTHNRLINHSLLDVVLGHHRAR